MNRLIYQTKKILIGLLVFFAVTSCENFSTEQKLERHKLEEWTGKLSTLPEFGTVEYMVTKVIKADQKSWYKFGKRKILFTCKASLKAGIDLRKLTNDDIKANFKKKSIEIKLPKAELISINIKPEDVVLVYEKTSLFRSSFSNEERHDVLMQGEKNIRENVSDIGILTDAEVNAKSFLESFLKNAGYKVINISFKDK